MTQSNPATTDPRPIHSSARQGQVDSVLGTRNLMTVAALNVGRQIGRASCRERV